MNNNQSALRNLQSLRKSSKNTSQTILRKPVTLHTNLIIKKTLYFPRVLALYCVIACFTHNRETALRSNSSIHLSSFILDTTVNKSNTVLMPNVRLAVKSRRQGSYNICHFIPSTRISSHTDVPLVSKWQPLKKH